MSTLRLIVLATLVAVAPACKKKEPAGTGSAGSGSSATTNTGSGSSTTAGSGSSTTAGSGSGSAEGSGSAAMAGSGSGSGSAAAPDANADSVVVLATHKEKKPDDPVQVHFEKFAVTKATFDAAKIEGGTATIELDATSIKTGSPKRDAHLQSPDYLNAPKFAKITIAIDNVKKKADKTYTATAKVTAAGVDKKYPVTFDVVDAKDDWIKIKAEHKFSRLDFKIGKDPKDKDESTAPELTIQMQLTLKKT